jgi:hypothetical protein
VTTAGRPDGFVLFGGSVLFARNPSFLEELARRDLRILAVTDPQPESRERLRRRMAEPGHPLSRIADVAYCDGADHPAILRQVQAWRRRHRLRGVLCLGEVFVEPAGLTADYLGLPSPGLRAIRVCRNKHLQRLYLGEWSPSSQLVLPAERERVAATHGDFPAVLKPVGRYASSGVQSIGGPDRLRSSLAAYPPDEVLLLEQRVAGREVSVEAIVQHGRVIFESVTEKRTNETVSRFFVEMGHTVPDAALRPAERAAVLAANRAVLARLAFQDGIAHAEYRVTEAGRAVLMEVAARLPGDGLLPLYHLATGRPMAPALLDVALGEPAGYPPPVRHARQVYLPHPQGTLQDVSLDRAPAGGGGDRVAPLWFADRDTWPAPPAGAPDDPPGLRQVVVLKHRGDRLGALTDSFDRAVTFLIDAPSPVALDALEAEVSRRCRIHTGGPAGTAGSRSAAGAPAATG